MVADIILRLLGDEPNQYAQPDKWPSITAIIIDKLIPVLIFLSLISPLLFLWWRKVKRNKDFTILNITLAIILGCGLAYGIWWLNEWSYGYGLGVIYREIYGQ